MAHERIIDVAGADLMSYNVTLSDASGSSPDDVPFWRPSVELTGEGYPRRTVRAGGEGQRRQAVLRA